MKNVLNFVVQSTLFAAQQAVKSIQLPADMVVIGTLHAESGINVLRNKARKAIVPDAFKNKVAKQLSYKEMYQANFDTHVDMYGVINGTVNFEEFVNKSVSRVINVNVVTPNA